MSADSQIVARSTRARSASTRLALMATVVLLAGLVPVPGAAGAQTLADEPYPNDIVDPRASTNGCGSQGADGTDVPDDWFGVSFTPACDWHDQCYGTKGLSQSYCDRGMLEKNLEACGDGSACRGVAVAYYAGVALFGGGPYLDGQFAACTRTPHRDARVHGDPHLSTFDGLDYDLMTAGEFTLIREADGTDAVQARFFPVSDTFTVVSGIAVRIGDAEVAVQLDPQTSQLSILVDGEPTPGSLISVDGGFVELGEKLEGVNQVVTIRRDDGLRVEGVTFGSRIDIGINVFEGHWGEISGLLGNADDDPRNDLAHEGGILDSSDPLAPSFVRGVYESGFAEYWRVAADDSMFVPDGGFDYHGEEARSFPRRIITLEDFFGEDVEAVRVECREAGLEGGDLSACMFDVLASGDETYVDTAARSATRATAVSSPEEVTVSVGGPPLSRPDGSDAERSDFTPLVDAILSGDTEEAIDLIDAGEPLDVVSEAHNLTPLLAAVYVSNIDIVTLLLSEGADPDLQLGDFFISPLAVAAGSGSLEIVELLLEAGASPTGISSDAADPLLLAVEHPDVAQRLLEAGADPNGSAGSVPPLYNAALTGHLDAARLLLDAGASVEGDVEAGLRPLAAAVLSARVDMVRLLLEAGANPNIEFAPGIPLRSMTSDEEIIELLGG